MYSDASDGHFLSLAPASNGNELFSDNIEQFLIQDLEVTTSTYPRNEYLVENINNTEYYGINNNQSDAQQIDPMYFNPFYYEEQQPQNKAVQKMNSNLNVQPELRNVPQAAKKRKAHRTVYSPTQRHELELAFSRNPFVSKFAKQELSMKLNLTETQIKTWFQNKRMKEKRKISKSCDDVSANLSLTSADSCSSGYTMSPSPPQTTSLSRNDHQDHPQENGNYIVHPNYVYEQCKVDLSLYPQNQLNSYANQHACYWQSPVNGLFQYNGISYLQQLWNSQFYSNFHYPGPHVIKTEPVEQYTEEQYSNNTSYEAIQTLSPYIQDNSWQLGNCSVDSASVDSTVTSSFN